VPGLAAKNAVAAGVELVSCGSAGNCAASGYYDAAYVMAFLVSERNGHWGAEVKVPGLADGDSKVVSMSCASAGNCSAAGMYGYAGSQQAFVVSEVNGHWNKAIELPVSATVLPGGHAEVNSVSCGSAGNCVGGGAGDTEHNSKAFLVTERDGHWGTGTQVPGLAKLNRHQSAGGDLVSCPSAGNCTAAGFYDGAQGGDRAFVVSERNGHWGKAINVPGLPH
jgi:hypothetical protein